MLRKFDNPTEAFMFHCLLDWADDDGLNPLAKDLLLKIKLDLADNVTEVFHHFVDEEDYYDALNEYRQGHYNAPCVSNWSRHYECEGRAMKLQCGRWVGWPYWYGGGKHGEPSAVPWLEDIVFLESWTETVEVRKFKAVSTKEK